MSYPLAYRENLCRVNNLTEPTRTKILRWLLCSLHVVCTVITAYKRGSLYIWLRMLTQWVNTSTTLYMVLRCFFQHRKLKPDSHIVTLLAAMTEFTLVLNVFVFVIYWTLLYKLDISRPEIYNDPLEYAMSHFNHLVPNVSIIVNYVISDGFLLFEKHGYLEVYFSLCYCVMNYYA